jgi:hypothetical protein
MVFLIFAFNYLFYVSNIFNAVFSNYFACGIGRLITKNRFIFEASNYQLLIPIKATFVLFTSK